MAASSNARQGGQHQHHQHHPRGPAPVYHPGRDVGRDILQAAASNLDNAVEYGPEITAPVPQPPPQQQPPQQQQPPSSNHPIPFQGKCNKSLPVSHFSAPVMTLNDHLFSSVSLSFLLLDSPGILLKSSHSSLPSSLASSSQGNERDDEMRDERIYFLMRRQTKQT